MFHAEMKTWRRDIHQHPETAFEEQRTSEIVAGKLSEWGIDVHRGLAGTGVVGVLSGQSDNGRLIGLRADMDALHIQELNEFEHRSTHAGKMHACGHDGHTTILLGNGIQGEAGGVPVHNPHYDFNDEVSVVGASYWATLVEQTLPLR